MGKKTTKLIGMKIEQFQQLLDNRELLVRPARLIPSAIKPGSEMALASIFLASLRLIKEFREDIYSELRFRKGGLHRYYVEVVFPGVEDLRPDGLILSIVSGIIRDAVFIEAKNKNNLIDDEQILKYAELAKLLGISKILTISNQFVSDPGQSPVCARIPKGISLYHVSWSMILTVAHVLLFQNDRSIADKDQQNLMREVVEFFEAPESGILGFTSMKSGWKAVVKQFTSGSVPKKNTPELREAIESWQQEEKDMALILSRKLGEHVRVPSKQDLQSRFESDYRQLCAKKYLGSKLRIDGAVSLVEIFAHFERRTITMSVELQAPDKTLRGQIGWLKRQLAHCEARNPGVFSKIRNCIHVYLKLKYKNEYPLIALDGLDNAVHELKGKEINSFTLSYILHLGAKFESGKKFVAIIEEMLMDFYSSIVQFLSNPPPRTPQMKSPEEYAVVEEANPLDHAADSSR